MDWETQMAFAIQGILREEERTRARLEAAPNTASIEGELRGLRMAFAVLAGTVGFTGADFRQLTIEWADARTARLV